MSITILAFFITLGIATATSQLVRLYNKHGNELKEETKETEEKG